MIDPLDFRTFPPVEPLSETPETFRQTLLNRYTQCKRSAYLELKYRGGPWTHPLAGGVLLHRTLERIVNHMLEHDEPTIDPETAKDILNETLVASTDLTVEPGRMDEIRAMVYHVAEGLAIKPEAVIGAEIPIELAVGNRLVTGTIDFAEIIEPRVCLVVDYKSAFLHIGREPEEDPEAQQDEYLGTKRDWAASFQTVLYALGLAEGLVAGAELGFGRQIEEYVLREIHPRIFWEREGVPAYREARITRAALLDWRLYLEALVASFEGALESWEFPAQIGSHCKFCPASAECPIPAPLRNYEGEVRTLADAQRAQIIRERHLAIAAELWKAVKGYAAQSRQPIRFGRDLELRWKTTTAEKFKRAVVPPGAPATSKKVPGREAEKMAVHNAINWGVPFDYADYREETTSTRLSKRTLTDIELTREREQRGDTPP